MATSLKGKAYPTANDIKLLISDVDGTLLDSNHKLPPRLVDSLKWLLKNRPDIPFIIASGKAKASVDFIREELDLPNHYPAAHCQGGAVYCGPNLDVVEEAITALPGNIAAELLESDHLRYKSCFAFTHDKIINCNHDVDPATAKKWTELSAKYDTNIVEIYDEAERSKLISDIKQGTVKLLKITFCDEQSEAENLMEKIGNSYPSDQLKVTRAIKNIPELVPPGVHKAAALDKILKFLADPNSNSGWPTESIPLENVAAFGDGDNDVEMLSAVGYGVCLKNSMPPPIAASQFMTTHTNDEGGVGIFIDSVFRPEYLANGVATNGISN